jgi:predicted tellurium resistance membrane protein TerC
MTTPVVWGVFGVGVVALLALDLGVFLLIFSYFRVPAQYQHTVLFWGIVGALVMRDTEREASE